MDRPSLVVVLATCWRPPTLSLGLRQFSLIAPRKTSFRRASKTLARLTTRGLSPLSAFHTRPCWAILAGPWCFCQGEPWFGGEGCPLLFQRACRTRLLSGFCDTPGQVCKPSATGACVCQ